MKDILTAPWMVEMIRTVTNMYDHGWDERNGGNVSLLLEESQVNDYVDGAVLREIPTGFFCPELDGKCFLVTGTGKYFKNVQYAPETAARRRSFSGASRTAGALPLNFLPT